MVDPGEVKECGLKIMNMNGIFNNIVAKVVCLTIDKTFFDPGTGHPHGKTTGVVISTIVLGSKPTL
jgi:hypothetical protein